MTGPRKICVVTGSRSDYGYLYPLLERLMKHQSFQCQVIAYRGGDEQAKYAFEQAQQDGFTPIPINWHHEHGSSYSREAKSLGKLFEDVIYALEKSNPTSVIVFGDRFEVFIAAQAAFFLGIPIYHIGGGDLGSGTHDDTFRDCISKFASLHFVSNIKASRRLVSMGIEASTIFSVGSLSAENITKALNSPPILQVKTLLGNSFIESGYILVCYHPLTLDSVESQRELDALLDFLDELLRTTQLNIVFTGSNLDPGSSNIDQAKKIFCARYPERTRYFESLGRQKFIAILQSAHCLMGNSSSGIYEAPYLKTPTVDIGTRQSGRVAPLSVIRSVASVTDIRTALQRATQIDWSEIKMIFGHGKTSHLILNEIVNYEGLNSRVHSVGQ